MVVAAISKPLESVTAADLQELRQRQWPETENVEYKGELHRERDNRQDPWYTGGSISGASKNKIFNELVAFANTKKVFNNREVSRGFDDVNGTWRRDAANLLQPARDYFTFRLIPRLTRQRFWGRTALAIGTQSSTRLYATFLTRVA